MLLELMKDLLLFEQEDIKSPILILAIDLVGEKNLYIISRRLVGWIKVEGMRKKTRNLDLWPDIPWCENLRLLIKKNPAFSQSFKVVKNYLTYNDKVTEEERQKAIEYVAKHNYTPPPLISLRR
ncbi:hypothetical protein [Gilliamella sp. Nev3-1]|uniref:hypothetical protein n=1 Tax=Gilliamella sp. Nev3-1 TaxID=3120250 RepID=UPI00080ED966|nr:hypothetical protein [Gilliamella apicola]OCG61427.1 hypothetical protein A9G40_00020 [Gilliamella apicola]